MIVGDPSTPRMQETLAELQRERREGDALEGSTGGYNPGFAVLVVLLLLWLAVGLLVIWRQPRNWAGWIFLITGAPFPLLTLAQALVVYGLKAEPGSVPLVGLWATLGEYALYPIALIPLLFLLYPDGHPPSRRWRWAVRGLVGGTAIAIIGFLVRPGPFNNWIEDGILVREPVRDRRARRDRVRDHPRRNGDRPRVGAFDGGRGPPALQARRRRGAAADALARLRRVDRRHVASSSSGSSDWSAEMFFRDADAPIFELFFALTAFTLVIGVPAAYLVAIFRHGLWDLDVVMKKTLQYGIVVVGLMAGVGLVLLVVPVFAGVSGDIAPAIAIGAVLATVFLLVRTRAQRLANRLVYGKRSTPYEVLSEFGERVGGTYSTRRRPPADGHAARRGDRCDGPRAVWLRIGDEMRQEAVWPDGAPAAPDVPVRDDDLRTSARGRRVRGAAPGRAPRRAHRDRRGRTIR